MGIRQKERRGWERKKGENEREREMEGMREKERRGNERKREEEIREK